MSRNPRGYTGYTGTNNPLFSRRQSSGQYKTTSSKYGSHYTLKNSWETTPIHRPVNKVRPMSGASKNPNVKGSNTVKSSAQGPTNKTLHNSKTIGYRPAGGITGTGSHTVVTRPTIGDHSVATNRNTSHQSTTVTTGTGSHCIVANSGTGSVSRSTAGDHIVPTSKITSQYSTAPYESHSFATNKDNENRTIHQHAVTKSSVREGHSISRPDQGMHQSPVPPFAHDITTNTTTNTNTTFTVSKHSNVTGVNGLTVGGGHSSSDSTNKGYKEPSVSTTQRILLNDTSNKQLTGGGNSSIQDDRPSHYKRDVNHDPYHGGVKKSTDGNGSVSFGSGYSGYTRNPTDGVGWPSHPKKQPVKGLSNLGNTCFYNAVMQNLTVLVILHKELNTLVNSSGSRSYTIPGGGNLDAEPLSVTINTKLSDNSLTSKLYEFLDDYKSGNPNPSTVLNSIGNKNTRFRGRSQQDSHELFRALLDGIRTEEADLIRKAIDEKLGNSMDGETKLKKKAYRRNIVTKIDDVFGGKTCSIVICRECHHVSQTVEPFLDLSLPIVDNQRASSRRNVMRNKMTNKQTTTFNGVCELIEQQKQEEDMAYPMMHERSHDGTCTIENCLSDYTDLEVMDEDNMFICSECNKKVPATGKGCNEPILSPVSKILLISELPPVLVLHLKRFSLGYAVRKDSKHVKFSVKLNMKKYCTNLCKGGYEYRLKGVVSHSGSLNFGHYIAYVCTDNQWYYASDSHVSTASTERVLSCEAYMLFYERTC